MVKKNKSMKSSIKIIIALIIAAILGFCLATSVKALSVDDVHMLQSAGIISAKQVSSLIATIVPVSVSSTSGYNFTKDLQVGSKGADVTALQSLLGVSPTTGYFGNITKAALVKFQISKGIKPSVGYFGSKTRSIVNSSASVSVISTSTPVVTTGNLTVSIAATSPSASAIIAGQASADLAEYTFANGSNAPVVVTNVTLQRTGISSDSILANVYLYNGASRLTDSASVSSGKINFNSAQGVFVIPANSSMTISVRADIANGVAGQLVAVSLINVSASTPVISAYPISGPSMSVVVSTDMAQVSSTILSSVIGNSSVEAGTLNQAIWGSSLNVSGRSVYLRGLLLKVIGSTPSNALQNIQLYVAGIQIASVQSVDSKGNINFDLSSRPFLMDSSRVLEVRADIVGGSSRSFTVSLQNATDLQVIDSNYNMGIASTLVGSQSSGTFTVSSGSVSVNTDPSLSNTDVVTGSPKVTLARYIVKAYGEDVKISNLNVSSNSKLDGVSLFVNGLQVGSTQTISDINTPKLFNSVNTTIPAGVSVTLEVKADIKYNSINLPTTSNYVVVSLSGTSNNAQSSYSMTSSMVPSVSIDGPSMKVVSAGVVLAPNSSISNSSVVPNKSKAKIGSFVFQTNSSEPVRIAGLMVSLGGSINPATSLSNLYVSIDGISTTPVQPRATNNFTVNVNIPVNSSKVIDIYADTSNTLGTIVSSLTGNGFGVNSNMIITTDSVVGQTITVGSGTLLVPTLNNTSPDAQLVVSNSSVQKIADYSFISNNGASTISEMYFKVIGPITSITVNGIKSLVVSGSVSISGLSLDIPVGYGGTNVSVSVQYAPIGLNQGASMQSASVTLTGYKYSSGNTNSSTSTLVVSSNTMVVVASKPIVSVSDPIQSVVLVGGTKVVARVTVSADIAGDISLINLPIQMVTSNGAQASNVGTVGQVKVGNTIVSTTGGIVSVGVATSTAGVINFGLNGYTIAKGQSVTFDIYGTVTLIKDNSIQTSITSADLFTWKDINGNATATGTAIYNFPTNSAMISY